jgi:3-oxoadipate enol-lactonase
MQIVDRGAGTPVVFIAGLQGRWEYMRRGVDALAEACRVITFSLCDEPVSGHLFSPAKGLDNFLDQIESALDTCGVARAAICGVSFGGLVALHFAARRKERAASLILVSTPGPDWHLRRSHEIYARRPWLFAPLFFAGMPGRLRAEFEAALPSVTERWRFEFEQLRTLVKAPLSPARMAQRARMIGEADRLAICEEISCPTIVVVGEPELDRVVPVKSTAAYARLIHGASLVQLDRTGHLGCLTRPREFTAIVKRFLDERAHAAA